MANALLHKVKVEDRLLVETVERLRSALKYFCGTDGEWHLSRPVFIELLSEELSDGSLAYEIKILETGS